MTIEIDPLETQHSDLDDTFRRHAFENLRVTGIPVVASELIASSPGGPESAQRTLDILVQRGMAILEGEALVAIDGLSVHPTGHRMSIENDDLFTWCAADALGIPAALGEDAQVATACPHCSAEITLTIRSGAPHAGDDLVLWLPTSSCSHVVTQFCPDVNFFCSREHLDAWRSKVGEAEGRVLSAEEVAELGRQWWAYLRAQREEVEAR
jgi:alkylmercury lyase